MIFILVFLGTLFLNLYIIIWGKGDLEKLKHKIPFTTYLREIEDSLEEMIGHTWTATLAGLLVVLAISMVVINVYLVVGSVVAIIAGTFLAKKLYQIPQAHGFINKIATYINRWR